MTFLDIRGLHKSYGPVRALDGVSLQVPAGSRTAIVGPSGSGKTTLLRIIAGFEAPDAGRVSLGDRVLASSTGAVPAHLRGIGFVPQEGALFPHLSLADNIGFGLPRNSPGRAGRIAELMDMVALDAAMLSRRPHELSGGQQQRVALARAMAQRPRLMLLDEPFSALDTGLRASTRKAVAQLLGAAGMTTILVTHDQAEAMSFADQVAVLRGGRLMQMGAPRDLYLRPVDLFTADFLGETILLPAQVAQGQATCALGVIAVNDATRNGAAQIMLRPEQLVLTTAPTESKGLDADACLGVVEDVDFGGALCGLSVRLLGASQAGSGPLLVRTPAIHIPPVGARVQISVRGQAHVFPAQAPQAT
ncbi:MAG: ABC transporter ATP-binding protein [Burkholderiaceae bacterium]